MDDMGLMFAEAVPQRCGACGHPHHTGPVTAVTGPPPRCEQCGCLAFTLHPDDLARIDAAEAEHAAYVGENPVLYPDVAYMLGRVLTQFEAEIDGRYGWDSSPAFGCIYLGSGGVAAGTPAAGRPTKLVPMIVAVADVPDHFWSSVAGGNPVCAIEAVAELAEQRPSWFDAFRSTAGLDPGAPTVAWWAFVEAYIHERPGVGSAADGEAGATVRVGEVRTLYCADVDNRVYTLSRTRGTGEVELSVVPAAKLRADIAAMGPAPDDARTADGLPPLAAAMLQLMRLARSEIALRDALA